MSAGTGRMKISSFFSDSEEQKHVLQETNFSCLLKINWLAARNTPLSSSKTTLNISAAFWWVLKSRGAPIKLDNVGFEAHP